MYFIYNTIHLKIMGNAISSIKSGFSICWKFVQGFTEGFIENRFECQSYPLVENIVNVGIIFPYKLIIWSPFLITGLSIEALRYYPVITLSHCFVTFELGVPLFSKKYILIMGAFQIGYYILKYIKDMKKEDWEAVYEQVELDLIRNPLRYEWNNTHQMYILR